MAARQLITVRVKGKKQQNRYYEFFHLNIVSDFPTAF